MQFVKARTANKIFFYRREINEWIILLLSAPFFSSLQLIQLAPWCSQFYQLRAPPYRIPLFEPQIAQCGWTITTRGCVPRVPPYGSFQLLRVVVIAKEINRKKRNEIGKKKERGREKRKRKTLWHMMSESATLGHQGSARRAYGELLPAGDGGGAERRWLEKVVHPGHRASTAFSPRFRECGSLNHEGKKTKRHFLRFFFFFFYQHRIDRRKQRYSRFSRWNGKTTSRFNRAKFG